MEVALKVHTSHTLTHWETNVFNAPVPKEKGLYVLPLCVCLSHDCPFARLSVSNGFSVTVFQQLFITDTWNFNAIFVKACNKLGFFFVLIGRQLSVKFVHFAYSHHSGGITSEHWLSDILCLLWRFSLHFKFCFRYSPFLFYFSPVLKSEGIHNLNLFIMSPLNQTLSPCMYDVSLKADTPTNATTCFYLEGYTVIFNFCFLHFLYLY